ncbi:MAG TPA: hypothetical protein VMV69_18830 [Pirellulales bacterium]|nr:hypothetical protein [Pirellulales bacterium]
MTAKFARCPGGARFSAGKRAPPLTVLDGNHQACRRAQPRVTGHENGVGCRLGGRGAGPFAGPVSADATEHPADRRTDRSPDAAKHGPYGAARGRAALGARRGAAPPADEPTPIPRVFHHAFMLADFAPRMTTLDLHGVVHSQPAIHDDTDHHRGLGRAPQDLPARTARRGRRTLGGAGNALACRGAGLPSALQCLCRHLPCGLGHSD